MIYYYKRKYARKEVSSRQVWSCFGIPNNMDYQ